MGPFGELLVLACDTCLGRGPSRVPHIVAGGGLALAGAWWCVTQALFIAEVRRRAIAGAVGFVVVLLAIASVTVVPINRAGVTCSTALNATSMRHFRPPSYWDQDGCAATGWRVIRAAQVVGSAGLVLAAASTITTWHGSRMRGDHPTAVTVGEPAH